MADLTLIPVADPPWDALVEHLVVRRHLGEQDDPERARVAAQAQVDRVVERTRVLDVVEGRLGDPDGTGGPGGPVVGRVWLVGQGEDQAVLWLVLDDPRRAGEVRTLVVDVARDLGGRRLTVAVFPGDPASEAFTADGGFDLAATQMRLDLRHDLPAEEVVVLAPMDPATWAGWMADANDTYAQERALAGESLEQARKVADEQMAELLPDGQDTEHHHFFVGRVGDETVGTLWLGTERPLAFVYDVVVEEHLRGRGYGAGLMRAGALWSQQHGAHALGLNVFGHNHGARALYGKLGYEVVELFVGTVL